MKYNWKNVLAVAAVTLLTAGHRCAISQASASLMINLIKGQSVEKALDKPGR